MNGAILVQKVAYQVLVKILSYSSFTDIKEKPQKLLFACLISAWKYWKLPNCTVKNQIIGGKQGTFHMADK